MLEPTYLECACFDPHHTMRIILDENDPMVFVDVQLTERNGFWRRLWVGLKYIFGKGAKPGIHWEETVLGYDEMDKLADIVNKYFERIEETVEDKGDKDEGCCGCCSSNCCDGTKSN